MSGLYSNPSLMPCFQVDPREDQDFNCREEKAQVIEIGGMSEKNGKIRRSSSAQTSGRNPHFQGNRGRDHVGPASVGE